MRASGLRGLIVVAAVVIGGILIAQAFPSSGTPQGKGGGGGETTSPSPKPTKPNPSPTHQALDCSDTEGVRVAVENATSEDGLAAATAARLQAAGYTVNPETDIGTAATEAQTTSVYFRTDKDRDAARCVKRKLVDTAVVAHLPAGEISTTPPLDSAVPVVVFLGADYAAAHPVT